MENLLFPFCSVPPLAPGPVVPKTSKKSSFLFLRVPRGQGWQCTRPRLHTPIPLSPSPVGSRVRSEDAMPSPTPPAQPWSQVSVAPHTQTPLRDARPFELGRVGIGLSAQGCHVTPHLCALSAQGCHVTPHLCALLRVGVSCDSSPSRAFPRRGVM